MPSEPGDTRNHAAARSVCPACNKLWEPTLLICPEDGSPLALQTGDILLSPSLRHEMQVNPADTLRGEDLAEGTVVGEYVVEGKLGQGGMGAVYAASHPLIGKKAAIKVIAAALCTDAAAVSRFVQEARAVNQIGHPNIVDIFSFGELTDSRCYFVMELLVGETLGERLARGRVPPLEAIEILDQITDALDAAHEQQIVHRDLKPDNVFLVQVRGNRQLVKLLDFGIAKLAGTNDANRPNLTKTGFIMGSPGYISPEQARGRAIDARSDIYALGALAFEMLCGRQVFTADNVTDLVILHCTEPPPRPTSVAPSLPAVLDELLLRMLEKDPARRPSMPEIRAGLAEAHAQIGAAQAGRLPSGHLPSGRLPLPTGDEQVIDLRARSRWPLFLAAVTAAAAAAILYLSYGSPTPDPAPAPSAAPAASAAPPPAPAPAPATAPAADPVPVAEPAPEPAPPAAAAAPEERVTPVKPPRRKRPPARHRPKPQRRDDYMIDPFKKP